MSNAAGQRTSDRILELFAMRANSGGFVGTLAYADIAATVKRTTRQVQEHVHRHIRAGTVQAFARQGFASVYRVAQHVMRALRGIGGARPAVAAASEPAAPPPMPRPLIAFAANLDHHPLK